MGCADRDWHTICYLPDQVYSCIEFPAGVSTSYNSRKQGLKHDPETCKECIIFVAHRARMSRGMHRLFRCTIFSLAAFLCSLLLPEQSSALQTHSQPEGIYVHQMAHILYVAALGYLYWDTRRSAFADRGWTYLRIFCLLTICWNVLALMGHAATQSLHPEDFTTSSGYLSSKINMPITFGKVVFYAAKLDHLLMVPAMFFLVLGLRSFYLRSLEEDNE
jgi:hypothetical protein